MKTTKFGLMAMLPLAAALTLGGCASTEETKQLNSDVQQASSSAAKAQSTADMALKEARAARAAAERAEKAANEAREAAMATDAKIDNMFKKSMQK